MKRYITNIFAVLCAALLAPSCSTDGVDNIPEGQGLITMNVETGTRAAGDPVALEECTVGIYDLNQEGALVRKYAKGNCPNQIALVAGRYRVKVQYGQKPDAASFDNCYYEGQSDPITLAAGATETAEVECLPQSLAVEVRFGDNFAELFNSYAADVTLGSGVTNGSLHYTENRTGYFTLPEDVTEMSWTFTGEHKTEGTITKTATFGVEMGKKYALSFKFSPDLPGYISIDVITIEVGSSIDWDDEFNFSNDPEITSTNSGFFSAPQVYAGEAVTVQVDAQAAITKLSVEAAGKTVDLINSADGRVTVTLNSSRTGATITLNPSFFNFACGDTAVTFKVEDQDGGQASKTATIRMEEGILPVAEADCDLWLNTVVLRAKSNGAVPVIKMRRAGDSEWQTATAAADGDHYTATFAPQWQSSQNAGNNNIYTPMTGTGVWAANTYEACAEIDGKVSMTTFTTQAGDVIPNAGLDEWSTWKVVGSIMTGGTVPYPNKDASTEFWVGGNNKTTNALCTGVEIEGSHGKCAQLKPKTAVGVFAAGNLFTGTFDAGTAVSDTYGNARFGVKYAFTGRPRALRFRCKITVSADNAVNGDQLPAGAIDPARVFCCVVDWTERHAVKSGLQKDESTFWNPVNSTALDEGKILGYADTGLITESNDWKTMEIPFVWYDKESMPTEGNYTMLISCSTSAYGDYTIGSENNRIWIEDFEWVY